MQTQLIADIADNYYTLLALDKELVITNQTLQNRIKDVETMKALKEGAVVNGAAVVQAEANRYAAEVTIPDIKTSKHPGNRKRIRYFGGTCAGQS